MGAPLLLSDAISILTKNMNRQTMSSILVNAGNSSMKESTTLLMS